ncbi:NUDIX domain-containing protein [Cohnella sp. AR92]|uniref:NUDIX hydrolase n=1 Tax=Cohnella sp. AR92 TaxID=648716 RepID=UPI000F8E3A41|nr:NUDIX domain-containing protein [Cohnella sp. AR92]RUS46734.1 NUDIX domain-containing protein [Cohnella sp. AR92]
MAEHFDIYDERGYGIGSAARSDVHALGLWHHTFHCWLVRRANAGTARILFQKRSPGKDTNPGRFDTTVAGHLSAGETVRDAAREMDEEIGWSVPFERLAFCGTVREEGEGVVRSVSYLDREVSYVYGCVTDLPLSAFKLQKEEVSGIYEADADELIALMLGERDAVDAIGVPWREPSAESASAGMRGDSVVEKVRAEDFVPREISYYLDAFRFLKRLAFKESSL